MESLYRSFVRTFVYWLLIGASAFFATLAFAEGEAAAPEPPPVPEPALVVQEIRCEGNESTSCTFISSHFDVAAGSPVNDEELESGKLRLSSLPNFKSVSVRLEKGSEKGRAIVVVHVEEASPIAKELMLGTTLTPWGNGQKIAGRLTHQNIFGSGKMLDLEISGRTSFHEFRSLSFNGRLQYVDPNLFGTKKNFMIVGAFFERYQYEYEGNSFSHSRSAYDIAIGRRFAEFSYFSLSYRFRPEVQDDYGSAENIEIGSVGDFYRHFVSVTYGWNSEDDAYFPTKGSRALFALGFAKNGPLDFRDQQVPTYRLGLGASFRKTWTSDGGAFWTINCGNPGTAYRTPLDESYVFLSVTYAREMSRESLFGDLERGRWYVEPGVLGGVTFRNSGYVYSAANAIKAGVRVESKLVGLIDLHILGVAQSYDGRESYR